jgi:hypothetical protein
LPSVSPTKTPTSAPSRSPQQTLHKLQRHRARRA